MTLLILGLLLFLGLHSVRIVAPSWREHMLQRWGETRWKLGYSLLAGLGLACIVMGYGQARLSPQVLWASPRGLAHLAGLLMLPSLMLLAAAYVPGNALKARLGHPMILAVKLWAAAHLLANNTLADLWLFGGFLLWAVLDFRSARRRPAATIPAGRTGPTVLAVVIGLLAWAALVMGGHQALVGVRPFS